MNKTTVASWRRGTISLEIIDWEKIATKRATDSFMNAAINKEAQLIIQLRKEWITFIPEVVSTQEWSFSYKWIEWIHFRDYREQSSQVQKDKAAYDLIECAYLLDKTWIIHGELIRPVTNVLVDKNGQIHIIDFERGRQWDFSWRNMKWIAQWLHRVWYIKLDEVIWLGNQTIEQIYKRIHKLMKSTKQTLTKKQLLIRTCLLFGFDLVTKRMFYNQKFWEELWIITPLLNTWIGRSIPMPMIITIVLTLLVIYLLIEARKRDELNHHAIVLFLWWSLWNLYDRVVYSWVRDFIDFHYWPVFNFADVFITLGAVIIFFSLVYTKK